MAFANPWGQGLTLFRVSMKVGNVVKTMDAFADNERDAVEVVRAFFRHLYPKPIIIMRRRVNRVASPSQAKKIWEVELEEAQERFSLMM